MRLPGGRCRSGGSWPRLGRMGSSRGEPPSLRQIRGYSLLKRGFGGNVDMVGGLEKRRQLVARVAQQRTYALSEGRWVFDHRGGAFHICPFRLAEVGRENRHYDFAFGDALFERQNEIVAPFDGLFVEKAFDAVSLEAAI